ncbi:hypothetical protein ACH5AL_36520 [Actinacidiphila glaucinigra]
MRISPRPASISPAHATSRTALAMRVVESGLVGEVRRPPPGDE